jgi:hypothetical protein
MTAKTFSEKFPELKNKGEFTFMLPGMEKYKIIGQPDIEQFCLSKQRVREAIENIKEYDECGEPGCCDRIITIDEYKGKLLKELGLEEGQ